MFPSESILDVSDLACERGYKRLFENVEFSLKAGEVTHLTGANGAGKTTLIRAIAGLFGPESGEVRWTTKHDLDISIDDSLDFAYLGHKLALRGDLTAIENLLFASQISATKPETSVEECLSVVNSTEYAQAPVLQLSAGQKQRIALARVIHANKQLWLLDEPGTALDSQGIEILQGAIEQHIQRNGMVLYSSHQPLVLNVPSLTSVDL